MLLKLRHRLLYQSGFSMIEVLVALLLISIGVLGIVAIQGETIQYTADSVERNKAAMLGNDLLESIRASPGALHDIKDQVAAQSDFFKTEGSAFPTAPSSCMPLPDATKDRLGCWTEQMKSELPGAGDLLRSDYYICRSSKPSNCDGKGSMLEIRLAWRGKQGACVDAADSSADTSLCHYAPRAEP